jgi:hypothetical protein
MNFDQIVQLILRVRGEEYGPAKESFTNIARRWCKVLGVDVTPEQVINCMIELKKARLDYNPTHNDSKFDIAGYEKLLAELKRAELSERAESSH